MTQGRTVRCNDRFGAVGGEVVRIDLKLWRRGDPNDVENMGYIEIANIGPTSAEEGRDFNGERYYEYRMNGADGVTLSGTVTHRRNAGIWDLLAALFDDDRHVAEEFHDA